MLQVSFFLRGSESARPDDLCIIYCQPAIDGTERGVPFSTRMKCRKKDWEGNRAADNSPLASNINTHLMGIRKRLLDIWQMIPILHPQESLSIGLLIHYFKNGPAKRLKPEPPTLLKALEMMVDAKDIARSTWKTYRTRKKNLTAFLENCKRIDILVTDVDYEFCQNFFDHLRSHGQSQNVANKHITMIRSVLEYCVDKKYLQSFPLGRANLSYTPPGEPKYLNLEQRLQIMEVNVKSLERVRDTAIFLMYTGFSYTDYCDLNSNHLVQSNGRFCFKKKRNKTNIFSMPPLLPEAERIIDKYGGIENLPRIQIDDFNKLLKVLGDLAGVTQKTAGFSLSTSVFRETFSSMCENELMFSERAIMFFMGHTNPRQLNTYSKVQPSRVFREMEVAEKYKNVG